MLDPQCRHQLPTALTQESLSFGCAFLASNTVRGEANTVMSEKDQMTDVLIILAHELGVALEMSYTPDELRELWPEALDGLDRARQILVEQGLAVPPVVDNVLKQVSGHK